MSKKIENTEIKTAVKVESAFVYRGKIVTKGKKLELSKKDFDNLLFRGKVSKLILDKPKNE